MRIRKGAPVNRLTRSFGTTSYDEIRTRAAIVCDGNTSGRYPMSLGADDVATIAVALRKFSDTCANASAYTSSERAQRLYLAILETLRIEEM